MEVRAKVLSLKNNLAYVRVFKESACAGCSGCSHGKGHHTEFMLCENNKSYECYAENSICAKPGDTVVISSKSGFPLLTAFITFIIPLLASVVAYMIAECVSSSYSIIASCVAFIIFFLICAFISNYLSSKHITNVISKIIEENGN